MKLAETSAVGFQRAMVSFNIYGILIMHVFRVINHTDLRTVGKFVHFSVRRGPSEKILVLNIQSIRV